MWGVFYGEGFSWKAPCRVHRWAGSEHPAVSRTNHNHICTAPAARAQGCRTLCSKPWAAIAQSTPCATTAAILCLSIEHTGWTEQSTQTLEPGISWTRLHLHLEGWNSLKQGGPTLQKQMKPVFWTASSNFHSINLVSTFCMANHSLQLSSSTEISLLMTKIIIQIIINYPKIPHPFVFGRHGLTFCLSSSSCTHYSFRTQNVQNITSNVTPARAKALKSPTVPSTAVRTKPSFWAVIVYSKSLWSGPTLQIQGEQNLFQKKHLDITYTSVK